MAFQPGTITCPTLAPRRRGVHLRFGPWLCAVCVLQAFACQSNGTTPSPGVAPGPRVTANENIVLVPPSGTAAVQRGPDIQYTPVRTSATGALSAGPGVEERVAAITTSEATVDSASGENFCESASAEMKGSDGVAQLVVTANIFPQGRNDYGCYRNATNPPCQYQRVVTNAITDPSMVVGGDNFMYEARMLNGGGEEWFRSANPCPSGCASPTWQTETASARPFDYNQLVYVDPSSNVWSVYNDNSGMNDLVGANVLRWKVPNISWFLMQGQCGDDGKVRMNPMAVAESYLLHVVYWNRSAARIEHTTFNMTTQKWSCQFDTVDSIIEPATALCDATSDFHVMPVLGKQNLEFDRSPRIAIDPFSNYLIVSFDSYNTDDGQVEDMVYYSPNGGTNWYLTLWVSGESAKSTVAVSTALFEVAVGQTAWTGATDPVLGGEGAEYSWISLDDGQSWNNGQWLSSARTFKPISTGPRNCMWGDYDSVTSAFDDSAFYYSWFDSSLGTNSVIRGLFNDQDPP
jgi:hypothetical protein